MASKEVASVGSGGTHSAHDDRSADVVPVEISRNPFTRMALLRIIVEGTVDPYCGEPARFRYGIGTLNGKPIDWDAHDFCGKDCRDTYYGRER